MHEEDCVLRWIKNKYNKWKFFHFDPLHHGITIIYLSEIAKNAYVTLHSSILFSWTGKNLENNQDYRKYFQRKWRDISH